MADESDSKVSQHYRDLGAEEPPRALDEAILAASRRPARPWTQRWAVPLSLAAVVVLSVTVTLRIQHEQPGIEAPEARPAPMAAPKQATTVKEKEAAPAKAAERQLQIKVEQARKPAIRKEPAPVQPALREQAQTDTATAVPPPPPPAAAPAGEGVGALAKRSIAAESATAPVVVPASPAKPAPARASPAPRAESDRVMDTPERELERIAELRRQERHEEADKALAEFRKRYSDYKIPGAVLDRVERR